MRTLLESYLTLEQTDLLATVLEAQTRASGSVELPLVEGVLRERELGRGRVLDVGSGEGSFLCRLAARLPRASFLGLEHNAFAVARGVRRARRRRLSNLRFEEGFFDAGYCRQRHDAVVTRYTLQHCSAPRDFLAAAFARLERRGAFVAVESVEDYTDSRRRDPVWARYGAALRAIHARGRGDGNVGKALGALLAGAGFRRVRVRLAVCAPSTVGYEPFRTLVLSTSALAHTLFPDLFDRRLLRSVRDWVEDRPRVLAGDPFVCTAVADGVRP